MLIKNMSETIKREISPTPENLEDQKYKKLQAADDEEEKIMKEIENVFTSVPNRTEAEQIVLKKWAPLLDEIHKKSDEALHEWLDAMKASGKIKYDDDTEEEGEWDPMDWRH